MAEGVRQRIRYRFENFLAKGGSSIFLSLTILFLVSYALVVGIRTLCLVLFPGTGGLEAFGGHVWSVFLGMTDPGNMGVDTDSSPWLKATIVMGGFAGVVIFSMLIAFITTQLDSVLHAFRKGRSQVVESRQTLILGWNERVVDVIRELCIANESEGASCIVILAEKEKEEMDDEISTLIPDTHTTRVVTRNGSTSSLANLRKMNAAAARSAIVLADCSQGASAEEKQTSDAKAIKTVLALISCQDGENRLNIVAELFTQASRDLFATLEDEKITAVDSWDILGKIMVQTTRTSGLAVVYSEILAFHGSELYFFQAPFAGMPFYELIYHFKDGVLFGIRRADGRLLVRPENDTVMEDGDEVVILAGDNSTIQFEKERVASPQDLPYTGKHLQKRTERDLILGWHTIGNIVVREYANYLVEGSFVDIVFHQATEKVVSDVERLKQSHGNLKIQLIDKNPLRLEDLQALNPFGYRNVIILSQCGENASPERVDSETMVVLLLLRKIFKDAKVPAKRTKIITQVLNSENQDLIAQTHVDDFIISNRMITMILAQLSEQPRIKQLYDDMFQEEGSEIYLKPAALYFDTFPVKLRFVDLMGQVNKRSEICIGYRQVAEAENPAVNFGVRLNPPKDELFELEKKDTVVVIAENEL